MALPRETAGLGFKEARNQYDLTKLYRYCVAIANEGGGRLILGVSGERHRRVIGTQAFRNINDVQLRTLGKRVSRLHPRNDGDVSHQAG
jgi:ATP-dependent DNA helicase RecG